MTASGTKGGFGCGNIRDDTQAGRAILAGTLPETFCGSKKAHHRGQRTIVQKQLNLNVSNSSLWMISTIIGMSIGMMTFGSIFDYFGPRRAFAIFLIGSALMVYTLSLAQNMTMLLIIGAVVGFFSNGMFGGYGAVISRLYPTEIRSSANNIIVNVGRAIGGFSSVVIGILMDKYNLGVVMGFLSALYLLSFAVMITLPGLKILTKEAKRN